YINVYHSDKKDYCLFIPLNNISMEGGRGIVSRQKVKGVSVMALQLEDIYISPTLLERIKGFDSDCVFEKPYPVVFVKGRTDSLVEMDFRIKVNHEYGRAKMAHNVYLYLDRVNRGKLPEELVYFVWAIYVSTLELCISKDANQLEGTEWNADYVENTVIAKIKDYLTDLKGKVFKGYPEYESNNVEQRLQSASIELVSSALLEKVSWHLFARRYKSGDKKSKSDWKQLTSAEWLHWARELTNKAFMRKDADSTDELVVNNSLAAVFDQHFAMHDVFKALEFII